MRFAEIVGMCEKEEAVGYSEVVVREEQSLEIRSDRIREKNVLLVQEWAKKIPVDCWPGNRDGDDDDNNGLWGILNTVYCLIIQN